MLLYSSYDISIWFFACLFSYPCIDLVRVIILRKLNRKSPLVFDNEHVHHYVYKYFESCGFKSLPANSLTGILISLIFSVVPCVIYYVGVLDLSSNWWLVLFIFDLFMMSLLVPVLKRLGSRNYQS